MKNKMIILSAVAAISTVSFGSSDIENRLDTMEKKITKLEKKLKKANKKLNMVKAHDAGDNIKWNVDFRSTMDKIDYKMKDGSTASNNALFANRLLLNMKFKPEGKVTFYGTLAYNKEYGDTANHSQSNTNPGYADFDWVTNENANDGTLKVKEAYWLYANDTFFGADMPWTASIGRRPSTGGLGINYREGDKAKSAIASTVNTEFDGASFKWNIDQVGGLEGSWFKLCMGRGITNAKTRFTQDGTDYSTDDTVDADSDMIGIILVPYDDGQYSLYTNYSTSNHMIGFTNTQMGYMQDNNASTTASFQDVGSLSLMTAMFKAEGLGDGISDFLDDTTFFASYSLSKTDPTASAAEGGMLGSADSKTGDSVWFGFNMPCLLTDDARLGIEWNKGSKYWRSMTYGEDTMIGSKIAARGTATEIYWIKPLTKTLTLNLRHTYIDYDYAGSNAFFGADGNPDLATNFVTQATDTRVSIRYRF